MSFAVVFGRRPCIRKPVRDTLLRLAELELYDPYWSERILDEVGRNLIADGRASERQEGALLDAMTGVDSASVPAAAVDRLESAMTNDPKDRHVLAAAVACDAQAVVVSIWRTSLSPPANHSQSSPFIPTCFSAISTNWSK